MHGAVRGGSEYACYHSRHTDTALIVVDLQAGIVGNSLAHPIDGVLTRTRSLLDAFRSHELPVVLVRVVGVPPGRTDTGAGHRQVPDGFADLVPELDQQPSDLVVSKQSRSAFTNTGLTERLRGLGVTHVVVVGISTSGGVESTARDAHEQGFHVTLPVDAMTDRTLDGHEHSVSSVFPRLAETGTTQDLLIILESTR